jgi:hypothetical protein
MNFGVLIRQQTRSQATQCSYTAVCLVVSLKRIHSQCCGWCQLLAFDLSSTCVHNRACVCASSSCKAHKTRRTPSCVDNRCIEMTQLTLTVTDRLCVHTCMNDIQQASLKPFVFRCGAPGIVSCVMDGLWWHQEPLTVNCRRKCAPAPHNVVSNMINIWLQGGECPLCITWQVLAGLSMGCQGSLGFSGAGAQAGVLQSFKTCHNQLLTQVRRSVCSATLYEILTL